MDWRRLQDRIGHRFADPQLLQLALTHRSKGSRNNERLEFLGDAILGFVVAEYLMTRFPGMREGQLSRLRAGLVKRETLAELARELQLGDFLILGAGELRSGGQTRSSLLSDGVEAIIAAVYLDAGIDAARDLVLRMLDQRLADIDPDRQQKDAKSSLQEYLQARRLGLPEYQVSSVDGDPPRQEFHLICRVPALQKSTQGQGSSRRIAEQQAAERMLSLLQASRSTDGARS